MLKKKCISFCSLHSSFPFPSVGVAIGRGHSRPCRIAPARPGFVKNLYIRVLLDNPIPYRVLLTYCPTIPYRVLDLDNVPIFIIRFWTLDLA